MYQVTITIHFSYGHRLMDYDGKCKHLHGHNGRVEIELSAQTLDQREMVRDFGEVKHAVKRWIDETFDHKMLLRRDDPVAPFLQQLGEPIHLIDTNPTAEAIAKLIFAHAARLGFPVTSVRLWETDSSFATYTVDAPTDR